MRSREAEDLIARHLSSGGAGLEDSIPHSVCTGLRRARPIYARKLREKEMRGHSWVALTCRRILGYFAARLRFLRRF